MSDSESPSWLPPQLDSVALRLARADQLAYEIGDLAGEWSWNGPLTLTEFRRGNAMELRVTSIRPIPPIASLMFSEAVNHLRAALDNVIWHLVRKVNPKLSQAAERKVNMPIYDDPEKFRKWTEGMVGAKISAVGPSATLGKRLRQLQPFEDGQSRVGSISHRFAAASGQKIEYAHPLLLLQAYSNADKHRAVRFAAERTFTSDDRTPFGSQDHRHRELRIGDVLGGGQIGQRVEIEMQTAVMIRRPEPFSAWVSPVRELNKMRGYLSGIAFPTLLTGLALPIGLPPDIQLGDTGASTRERIAAGGWSDAPERLVGPTQDRFKRADARGFVPHEIIYEDTEDS